MLLDNPRQMLRVMLVGEPSSEVGHDLPAKGFETPQLLRCKLPAFAIQDRQASQHESLSGKQGRSRVASRPDLIAPKSRRVFGQFLNQHRTTCATVCGQ